MEKKKENLNQRSVQQQIGMISDQKCTVQISITHSLHSFQNCKIQLLNKYIFKPAQVQVYYRSSTQLVCKKLQKLSFLFCNLIDFLKNLLNLIFCCILIERSHWLGNRCSLEQEVVHFINKSGQ